MSALHVAEFKVPFLCVVLILSVPWCSPEEPDSAQSGAEQKKPGKNRCHTHHLFVSGEDRQQLKWEKNCDGSQDAFSPLKIPF